MLDQGMAYVGWKNESWYSECMAFKTAASDSIFELWVIELTESKAVPVLGAGVLSRCSSEYLH